MTAYRDDMSFFFLGRKVAGAGGGGKGSKVVVRDDVRCPWERPMVTP